MIVTTTENVAGHRTVEALGQVWSGRPEPEHRR